jgi:hypothetical protein
MPSRDRVVAQAESALAGWSKGVSSARIAAASASVSPLNRRCTRHRCCPILPRAPAVVIRGLRHEAGAGVIFIAGNGDGPGVRLKKRRNVGLSQWRVEADQHQTDAPPSGGFWEPTREIR